MKKRNSKEKKSIQEWIEDYSENPDDFEISGEVDMSKVLLDSMLQAKWETKVKRKGGKIHTYILLSDGSLNMDWPDMRMKKGDKFI